MIAALIIALFVTAIVALASLSAWYGIYLQREEDRARLMRGSWTCEECGRTMRFIGDTVDQERGGR